MLARVVALTAETNNDEDLHLVSSATHIASSELRIAVGKCLPGDRCKASDIRTGPGSAEGLQVVRAFAARLDRLKEVETPMLSADDEVDLEREMAAIAREERANRGRHGWR